MRLPEFHRPHISTQLAKRSVLRLAGAALLAISLTASVHEPSKEALSYSGTNGVDPDHLLWEVNWPYPIRNKPYTVTTNLDINHGPVAVNLSWSEDTGSYSGNEYLINTSTITRRFPARANTIWPTRLSLANQPGEASFAEMQLNRQSCPDGLNIKLYASVPMPGYRIKNPHSGPLFITPDDGSTWDILPAKGEENYDFWSNPLDVEIYLDSSLESPYCAGLHFDRLGFKRSSVRVLPRVERQ